MSSDIFWPSMHLLNFTLFSAECWSVQCMQHCNIFWAFLCIVLNCITGVFAVTQVKLQAIRSDTGFGTLRKTHGLWSVFSFTGRFYLLMQYFGLEMQYTENGFSRNCLLRLKGSCWITVVRHVSWPSLPLPHGVFHDPEFPTLLFVLVWYSLFFVVRKSIAYIEYENCQWPPLPQK
jgi:hypothetical protein